VVAAVIMPVSPILGMWRIYDYRENGKLLWILRPMPSEFYCDLVEESEEEPEAEEPTPFGHAIIIDPIEVQAC
jgi:hypothetical protein